MEKHSWEMVEIVLTARNQYADPYNQVDVWADLTGPGVSKRVYGFWDGADVFKIRLLAQSPGAWTWRSGSNTFFTSCLPSAA